MSSLLRFCYDFLLRYTDQVTVVVELSLVLEI